MRALPYGFPKIMVSTMASGNVAPWVGTSDITMMFSVTDIMGLNPFMRHILANAAGAACGMAQVDIPAREGNPLVAITTVGITTTGAMAAAKVLEDAGYETILFHAVGTGGRAMEEMMRQGLIGAVLDFSTIEVSNEMHHALLAGGPDRLDRRRRARPAAGALSGRDRGAGLQRAGDRARPLRGPKAGAPQPADHRPPAQARGDGRSRPRSRPAAAERRASAPCS